MVGLCGEVGDGLAQGLQGPRREAVADGRPLDLADDHPGLLQDREVLRHRGLRQWQIVHDVAADTGATTGQESHDMQARRVAEGLEELRDSVVRFYQRNSLQVARPLPWLAT